MFPVYLNQAIYLVLLSLNNCQRALSSWTLIDSRGCLQFQLFWICVNVLGHFRFTLSSFKELINLYFVLLLWLCFLYLWKQYIWFHILLLFLNGFFILLDEFISIVCIRILKVFWMLLLRGIEKLELLLDLLLGLELNDLWQVIISALGQELGLFKLSSLGNLKFRVWTSVERKEILLASWNRVV